MQFHAEIELQNIRFKIFTFIKMKLENLIWPFMKFYIMGNTVTNSNKNNWKNINMQAKQIF